MKLKKAFSLMEVLIFVTILSFFFVAAMIVATFSLRNMRSSEYKILAAHYAEEGIEWVRSEKEADWSLFTDHDDTLPPGTGTIYCLNSDILSWGNKNPCLNYSLGTPAILKREVLLKNSGTPPDKVNVTLTVSWIDTNGPVSIPVKTVLKVWE